MPILPVRDSFVLFAAKARSFLIRELELMDFINRLFKKCASKKEKSQINLRLETLEDRTVPTSVTLNTGMLMVVGTNAPDRIAITLDQSSNQIVVLNGNQEAGRFASTDVTSIYLYGGNGNDSLQVASQIMQPAFIDGGLGNDRIFGGGGSSMIMGGDGANRLAGGTGNDSIIGQGMYDILGSASGVDTLTGGPGVNRFFGFADQATITNLKPTDLNFFLASTPNTFASTLGLPTTTNVTLTAQDVDILLQRAAAATASNDGMFAIVDREGRILGVRVEDGVNPKMNPNSAQFDPDLFVFAVDGAVALARTGAMFGNNQAPLTSRTIGYISQTTIEQREVESNPSITDVNSTLRGPGYVAAVGIGNHFPPGSALDPSMPDGIAFTPQVDLFGIEQSNRDSTYHPGPDRIKGTADDIYLPYRFNINPAFIPSNILDTFYTAPDSYGYMSGYAPNAQNRGIATLPGGIPIVKNNVIVGGIGSFFPGATGFATEMNSRLSTTYNANLPDRSFEAEYISFAASGGFPTGGVPVQQTLGGIALPTSGSFGLNAALSTIRIDLVGITLPIFGPAGTNGIFELYNYGQSLGEGTANTSFLANLLPRGGITSYVQYTGTPPNLVPVGIATPTTFAGIFAPEGYLVTPHDGVNYSAAQVNTIIMQSVERALQVRSAIRLPLNQNAKMTIAVTDVTGEVLGLFRMPDGTTFSLDIAVAKARNMRYYNDPTQLQAIDQVPGVPAGTAFTNRTVRFLALPRFPEGINGAPPGYFSQLNDGGASSTTGLNTGAPLPASVFQSVFGFSSFNPQSNFRQPNTPLTPVQNQNGNVYFPGSSGLYVGGQLIAGFGISGDGVDQDDVVTFAGQAGYNAPDNLRADMRFVSNVRLPYQKFNRQPLLPQGGGGARVNSSGTVTY